MHIVSEANLREHWRRKWQRGKMQKKIVWAIWNRERPKVPLPCRVVLTRHGCRFLDTDNLAIGFKAVRDQLADLIIPGQAKGQADGDPRIDWIYMQEKSKINRVGIDIYFNDLGDPKESVRTGKNL